MNLYEQLSALLDGDLSAEEEAAVRQRIATEPEVAAAFEHLRQVTSDLSNLPEEPAPRELDEKIARRDGPATVDQAWRKMLRWGGWVAAAAIVVVLLPGTSAQHVIVDGTELVEGDAAVWAGDHRVEVDGAVRIAVTPPADLELASTRALPTRDLVRALDGSRITVDVVRGSALVWSLDGSEAEPVRLVQGAAQSFGPLPTGSGRRARRAPCSPARRSRGRTRPHRRARAARRRARLRGGADPRAAVTPRRRVAGLPGGASRRVHRGRIRGGSARRDGGLPGPRADRRRLPRRARARSGVTRAA